MTKTRTLLLGAAAVAAVAAATATAARAFQNDGKPKYGYTDTPQLPNSKYKVHDSTRPLPKVVTPGTASSQETPGKAPSDAVVLFDGTSLDKWRSGNGPAKWAIEDGALVIAPKAGGLTTKDDFGDCQLHLEFASPTPPKGSDQGRGNSGIEFFGRYEVQVLDTYDNPTYADGHAAAIYGQVPPLVNASRPPGQWQTYDIVFLAPKFKADGSLESPAYVTMFHNGVLVHNHAPAIGPVKWRGIAPYTAHGPKGPINLQDHGNPVRFRNIWLRELKGYDE